MLDACNPATGQCGLPQAAACDDGDLCTDDDQCSGGVCIGTPLACSACEVCDPIEGCVLAPRTSCRVPITPGRTTLLLLDRPSDVSDRLAWSWAAGEDTPAAALGDPTTADTYTLCMFTPPFGDPDLLMGLVAPADGQCADRDCWKAKGVNPVGGRGYRYKDRLGTPDGLELVLLRPGGDGRAKMSVKGQGPLLQLPAPDDVDLPLLVQLQATNGECWEARFFESGVLRREPWLLKVVAGSPAGAFLDGNGGVLD
jgi:hypothetical protein